MARQRLKSELSAAFTCRSDRQPTTCSVVNTANENGETCLMMACENGSVDIVRILLDEGADPNLVDKKADNGDTAFHKCARSGDLLSMTFLISVDPQGPFGLNHDKDTPLRAAALEGADAMTQTLINTVPAYSHEERIDALELLGVGLLAKDIAREWDVGMVVGFWQEAMAIRKARGIPFPEPRPSLFPLEYFLEARSSVELEEFRSNPSVLTAQALQICDRLLPKYHSRLPALLGTVGERFAQIGEFCRSLNIWQYVLDIQLQNLQKSTDGVEDVMNTFRCFADAFGFVLSRSVDVLSFDVVHTVVKRALDSLRNHPAIFDLRETIMPYLLHYFVSLLSVAINDQDFAVAMDTIRSFVRLGLRNKHGSTLLHLAVSSKTGEISSLKEHLHFPNLKLCERLVECGADVDATDSDRNTPLHTLLTRGHAERDILEFLLKVGCHVDARNKAGKSAEDLARCNKVKQAIRASGIVPRLHCLAARTVLAEEIEYEGIVPRRLESFIQMH
ncbi:predicted protein [Nematostella vectensis]|uniref:Uncharacterized protein n=1 Tax=Nematostella vectensis TaxID=45351 RepID=A7RT73_NEMVE|nr:predicted protein [Nematostella vectensis]|eukprot:XP_001637399.1 predicted protein [Nematostella vectensis]